MNNHKYYAVFMVMILELSGSKILNLFFLPMLSLMIIRLSQIIVLFAILKPDCSNLDRGIKTGLLWSVKFGIIVLIIYFIFTLIGINTIQYCASKLPENNIDLILFLISAGIISPIAEELFFRGLIYSYFRKYNFPIALILSTIIFALSHFQINTFPIIQIIGGIVFAVSFEYSKSLAAPIIIHIAGNLAIFLLSFFYF